MSPGMHCYCPTRNNQIFFWEMRSLPLYIFIFVYISTLFKCLNPFSLFMFSPIQPQKYISCSKSLRHLLLPRSISRLSSRLELEPISRYTHMLDQYHLLGPCAVKKPFDHPGAHSTLTCLQIFPPPDCQYVHQLRKKWPRKLFTFSFGFLYQPQLICMKLFFHCEYLGGYILVNHW